MYCIQRSYLSHSVVAEMKWLWNAAYQKTCLIILLKLWLYSVSFISLCPVSLCVQWAEQCLCILNRLWHIFLLSLSLALRLSLSACVHSFSTVLSHWALLSDGAHVMMGVSLFPACAWPLLFISRALYDAVAVFPFHPFIFLLSDACFSVPVCSDRRPTETLHYSEVCNLKVKSASLYLHWLWRVACAWPQTSRLIGYVPICLPDMEVMAMTGDLIACCIVLHSPVLVPDVTLSAVPRVMCSISLHSFSLVCAFVLLFYLWHLLFLFFSPLEVFPLWQWCSSDTHSSLPLCHSCFTFVVSLWLHCCFLWLVHFLTAFFSGSFMLSWKYWWLSFLFVNYLHSDTWYFCHSFLIFIAVHLCLAVLKEEQVLLNSLHLHLPEHFSSLVCCDSFLCTVCSSSHFIYRRIHLYIWKYLPVPLYISLLTAFIMLMLIVLCIHSRALPFTIAFSTFILLPTSLFSDTPMTVVLTSYVLSTILSCTFLLTLIEAEAYSVHYYIHSIPSLICDHLFSAVTVDVDDDWPRLRETLTSFSVHCSTFAWYSLPFSCLWKSSFCHCIRLGYCWWCLMPVT